VKLKILALVIFGCLAGSVGYVASTAHADPYGKCNFDSDCHPDGAKCHSGVCSNAPGGKCNFDSECPGQHCQVGGHCG
jgi:hypothetical protein